MIADTYRFVLLLIALLIGSVSLAAPASAQETGSIAGVVVDAASGETLVGANVAIQDSTIGTATDLNGSFEIRGLDPGTYNIVFSFIGFQRKTVTGVEVNAGETSRVEVSLQEQTEELEEVVVTAAAARDSEAGLLRERQKAASVSDAISAETISQSGSSTAADALGKVTGASVQDGKYVNVRGLGGRYVNAELNGAELPSADPDQNSVPLDLFPAGLLDNVVTSKTFTPDKPGSFTGGNINLNTKSFPENLTFSLSASTSYNSEVQYGDIQAYTEGAGDVPDVVNAGNIPRRSEAFQNPDAAQRIDAVTRAFSNTMAPVLEQAPINQSYSASFGNRYEIFGGRPLGVVASLSYSRSASAYSDGQTGRYSLTATVDETDVLDPQFELTGEAGTEEELIGGIANITFKPHSNHQIGFNGLYNLSDERSARQESGPFQRDLGRDELFFTRILERVDRRLLSLQGRGEHVFGSNVFGSNQGVRIDWNSTYSDTQQEEPDVRFFNFDLDPARDNFTINTAAYPAPNRYFRDLTEYLTSNDLSITVPVAKGSFKAGGRYMYKERELDERRFEYETPSSVGLNVVDGDPFRYFGECAGVINEGECGDVEAGTLGALITDATEDVNNFTADRTIIAGFGMVDYPILPALRLIGGMRVEQTDQSVINEANQSGSIDETTYLPSLNLVYAVQENMNVRAAYGRTLARPNFREFSPFAYYDFQNNETTLGNPDLEITTVNNFDLRWEWFLNPGELIAVSGYYKDFTNPIERTINPGAVNREIQFENQSDAQVFGAEFEVRKSLSFLGPWAEYFETGGNLTLAHSEVTISEDELQSIRNADPDADDTRALQGQSPYVINFDLAYENPIAGTTISAFYNTFGDRLDTIERAGTPNVFEESRHTIDIIASQRLGPVLGLNGVEVQVSAKNLLNEEYRLIQEFEGQTYVNRSYVQGRSFSLSLQYTL